MPTEKERLANEIAKAWTEYSARVKPVYVANERRAFEAGWKAAQ